jgi:hypothetical protein
MKYKEYAKLLNCACLALRKDGGDSYGLCIIRPAICQFLTTIITHAAEYEVLV